VARLCAEIVIATPAGCGDSKQHHPAHGVTDSQRSISSSVDFESSTPATTSPQMLRRTRGSPENMENRRHIRIITDAIGGTLMRQRSRRLARFGHAEMPFKPPLLCGVVRQRELGH